MRVMSSAGIVTPDALTFSATCSGRDAPDERRGDVVVLQHPRDRELRHAQVQLVGDGPEVLHAREHVVGEEALDHARAALVVGRARSRRQRLAGEVLAGQHALRHGRPDDLREPELARRRHDLVLDDAPEHGVLRLGGDELEPEVLRERVARADLARRPLGDADVQGLALAHDVGERCIVSSSGVSVSYRCAW